MPHFTKHINTSIGRVEFFFNRIYTVNGTRYHVSVLDDKRHSHLFNMAMQFDKWHIIKSPLTPEWILEVESELATAIDSH